MFVYLNIFSKFFSPWISRRGAELDEVYSSEAAKCLVLLVNENALKIFENLDYDGLYIFVILNSLTQTWLNIIANLHKYDEFKSSLNDSIQSLKIDFIFKLQAKIGIYGASSAVIKMIWKKWIVN